MYILFTLTLKQDSFQSAIIIFGIFQVLVTFLFKIEFHDLKEKFRTWGNYMTDEEEEQLGFD